MLQNKKPAGGKDSASKQYRQQSGQITDFHFSKAFITTAVINAVLAVVTVLAVRYCSKGAAVSFLKQFNLASVGVSLLSFVNDSGAINDVMKLTGYNNDHVRLIYECLLLLLLYIALLVVVVKIIELRSEANHTISDDIKLKFTSQVTSQGFDVCAAEVRFVRKDAYARAMRDPSKQSLDEYSHTQTGYYY
jgi:glucan phosphoethanolaminetransferase (alkaline phosphatase superfamily)